MEAILTVLAIVPFVYRNSTVTCNNGTMSSLHFVAPTL